MIRCRLKGNALLDLLFIESFSRPPVKALNSYDSREIDLKCSFLVFYSLGTFPLKGNLNFHFRVLFYQGKKDL